MQVKPDMGSPAPGIPNAGLGEPPAGSVDAAGGSNRLNTASLKGFHLLRRNRAAGWRTGLEWLHGLVAFGRILRPSRIIQGASVERSDQIYG